MKYLSIIFLLSIIGAKAGFGQVKSAEPAFFVDSGMLVWEFHSKVIGEDYTIYVNLPSGYDTSKTNYRVLYMTDGDWNMNVIVDCFSMLEQDYDTTTPIIVGVGYGQRKNMRTRDLDPATGGPKFLSFIETEVMPFIKSKYHTNGDNALYGYSYGGLFTTSVLFGHPGLFDTIFIGAPGNNGRQLIPEGEKYFATHTDLKCNVFAGVGSYEPETAANVNKFDAYLQNKNCKSLNHKTVIVPDVAHGAGLAPVMQSAMKFAYCRMHKTITVPVNELAKYAGNYRSAEMPALKLRIFIKDGNLYFQQGENIAVHYVPYAKDHFFIYENEKFDISFKNEAGKQYMLCTTLNGKPQRIDKID